MTKRCAHTLQLFIKCSTPPLCLFFLYTYIPCEIWAENLLTEHICILHSQLIYKLKHLHRYTDNTTLLVWDSTTSRHDAALHSSSKTKREAMRRSCDCNFVELQNRMTNRKDSVDGGSWHQGNGFPPRVASLHIRREMCPLGVSVQLKPVNVMSFWHFAWWGESSVRWTVLSLKASHDAWWSINCSITVIFAQHVPCF